MSNRIKLGLIGVQKWGRQVGRQMAASDIVDLAWVYDLDAGAAAKAGGEWNAKVAGSLDELLASDVLGVVIVTPNHTHLDLGLRAASAGKHPMIIKPITNTIAEGRQLIEGCRKAGVFCASNHPARKSPISRYVKESLDAGAFGRLILVSNVTGHNGGMGKQPTDWRAQRKCAPGGPLIQLVVHTFDTWQYWFGPIVEIQATGGHRATPGDNDDYFAGQARFEGGLIGNFATQYAAPGVGFHVIYGTERTLVAEGGAPFEQRVVRSDRPAGPGVERIELELEPYDGIRRDVEEFATDIQAGRQPHASGEDGLRALACVHAAIRSNEGGGAWVKVADVLAGK
ncbi:MAG: Gfo/Idh/MocA family oxidoreductase [Phycisphaerae bacterium]|nr:Gfo/Idh/MocA family oxidoreductase [Phycisphaerae bacterium]